MKTKTYLIVSIALLTGVSTWAQAWVSALIYEDCSTNGKKEDFHTCCGLDLPSGILWAACNIGAEKPEDYGNYYAWGETTPKENYSWATYKYANGDEDKLTKYCSNYSYGNNGFRDYLTTLKPEDDAAHVNWGGNWRMPTDDEWTELYENCTWTLTAQNGVIGYRVTGKNRNSIFLPAAGFRKGTDLFGASSYGLYWSTSLRKDYPYWAWNFYFYPNNTSARDYNYRYIGLPVRPVCCP